MCVYVHLFMSVCVYCLFPFTIKLLLTQQNNKMFDRSSGYLCIKDINQKNLQAGNCATECQLK